VKISGEEKEKEKRKKEKKDKRAKKEGERVIKKERGGGVVC